MIDARLREQILELDVRLQVESPFGLALKDDVGLLLLDGHAPVGALFAGIDAVGSYQVWQDDTHRQAVHSQETDVGHHGLVRTVHEGLRAADEPVPGKHLSDSPSPVAQSVLLAQFHALAVAENDVHHAMLSFLALVVQFGL